MSQMNEYEFFSPIPFIIIIFFGLVLCYILVNRCKYVIENERFGDQSVAKRLFKFEVFYFLLFFFTFNCIVLPYVTNWYLFAKYK